MIWNGITWACPHCRWVNADIREICRNCGYDSNAGEFPYYNPLPPYEGREPPDYSAKGDGMAQALRQSQRALCGMIEAV